MSLQSRPFAGESDLPRLLALHQAIAARYPHAKPATDATIRFEYLEPIPEYRVALRFWEREGGLAGSGKLFAPLEPGDAPVAYARIRVHPEADTAIVGGQMVGWAEAVAADWHGGRGKIEVTARREDPAMIALLKERGYGQDRVFLHLARPLDVPVTAAPLPDGYTVRPTAGEAELDDWMALFNAAFRDHYDFRPWTREDKLQEIATPWYRPELDLVAVAPDGSLAAVCWSTRREETGGLPAWDLDLVATAREHRRKGIAGALIASSIARMNALGGGTVDLAVDAISETGANRLYERLGFVEIAAFLDFRRALGGTPDPARD